MDTVGKRITISRHAAERMAQRGAVLDEVEQLIRTAPWQPAQRGKWHARRVFPFDAASPVNGQHYAYKTVDAVFADNPASIVVVTVKVYYHD
ncbi:MAG: DUF4258 domain-containing protein [Thermoguttaceae bacterium]|jgi:hypothetical protein